MTEFNKTQMIAFRKLINAIHPDKVSEERKALATTLVAAANAARDSGDFETIRQMLEELANGSIWEEATAKKETREEAETRAKSSGKAPTVDPETLATIKKATEGLTRRQVMGWCQLNTALTGKEIKAYLDEIFQSEGKRAGTYTAAFYATLVEKPMTEEEFQSWLSQQSDNVKKNERHYRGIKDLANAIHAQK